VWPRLLTGNSSVTPCSTLKKIKNDRLTRSVLLKSGEVEQLAGARGPASEGASIMQGGPARAKDKNSLLNEPCGIAADPKACLRR
jgi:hypothetical protein